MKKIVILALLPLLIECTGRNVSSSHAGDVAGLTAAIDMLMTGMVDADEAVLLSLTSDDLVYGHSTGAVQNKGEFIAEIIGMQPLDFVSIELLKQEVRMAGDTAVVHHIFTARTTDTAGQPGEIRIGVMQIWRLNDDRWRLFVRQGYRL